MTYDSLDRKIIFGRHPVEELLQSDLPIEKIFILQSLKGPFEITIRSACQQKVVPLIRTQQEYLNRISGGRNHQGIVAISSAVPFQEISDIIPFLFEQQSNPLILVLDHITDVRNFGAIARSAEIFGVHAIVVPKKGSAAITDEAIKTSSGALLKIPVCRVSNLADLISELKDYGIQVFGAEMSAENTLIDMPFAEPLAIIMGAEGKGVQKELLRLCSGVFKIRQVGKISSLNVSVATGIILHEIQRIRDFS